MKKTIAIILIQLVFFQFNSARADDLEMGCGVTDLEVPSLLKYAPSGAKRLSRHVLQVNWKNGKALFEDPMPYDDELGHGFAYCGYSAKAKVHLIQQGGDMSYFSGVLINEETGEQSAAGQHVLLSPGLKFYFASSQPDGLDGQEWEVYSINGISMWKGYSFIENPSNKGNIYAELSWPFWNAQGKLESSYQCLSASNDYLVHKIPLPGRTKVILEEVDGAYAWAPEAKCAKAKGDE